LEVLGKTAENISELLQDRLRWISFKFDPGKKKACWNVPVEIARSMCLTSRSCFDTQSFQHALVFLYESFLVTHLTNPECLLPVSEQFPNVITR
jgi:hypothetical protein